MDAREDPIPNAPYVEFDFDHLIEEQEGPLVFPDVGLSDLAITDLKNACDRVRMNGNADDRLRETNRILAQLAHFNRNYCQPANPTLVAETKVRFGDRLWRLVTAEYM